MLRRAAALVLIGVVVSWSALTWSVAAAPVLACVAGREVLLTGTTTPQTPLLLLFDDLPIGGTTSSASGAYALPLRVDRGERPGAYAVAIVVRHTRRAVYTATCNVARPGTPVPVPVAVTSSAPTAQPRATVQPTTTSLPTEVPVNPATIPQPSGACAANAPTPAAGAQAWMVDAAPQSGANVTVCVRLIASGAAVSSATVDLRVAYKTTTTPYSGVTSSDGVATISFDTGNPTKGEPVNVNADVLYNGRTYTATTSFTPQ